jgi:integrase
VNAYEWTKKTYNNAVSVVRRAFDYGYKDHPEKHNPAVGLKCLRITKKDRPVVDPFTIDEAESLIVQLRADWGDAIGNYDELRFFTGLRPSEQIALLVTDFDERKGVLRVTKARVLRRDKDRTKTQEDRNVDLTPRAIQVLKAHLELRAAYVAAGKISHDRLFFLEDGSAISDPEVDIQAIRNAMDGRPKVSLLPFALESPRASACQIVLRPLASPDSASSPEGKKLRVEKAQKKVAERVGLLGALRLAPPGPP